MTQSPRTNCPICGKRMLGARNVRMHVAEKHPDQAQADATSPPAHPGDPGHPDANEDAIIAAEGIRPEDAGHPYGLEHPEPDHG